MARPVGFIGPLQPGMGSTSLGSVLGSPAAGLAGGLLAMQGLQRGGLSGLGMTVAGGALLGGAIGGPLGAAIGAGVGAIAGSIRLLFKAATEKAREKIRAVYGVDIQDKGILQQIVQIAKQGFGGNLDMAIRAPRIRELIELYALSTGQSTSGLPAQMQPIVLAQSGGALFQTSLGASVLPERIQSIGQTSATPVETTVRIEVPLTLDGQVIESKVVEVVMKNGRIVTAASVAGMKDSAGRRELTALQVSPGLLTT